MNMLLLFLFIFVPVCVCENSVLISFGKYEIVE